MSAACIQGISSTQIMCASALWEWASRNAATRALKAPSDPSAIRIFLNMGGLLKRMLFFRTKALIGLGSVAALYQITEGMPGRVTD